MTDGYADEIVPGLDRASDGFGGCRVGQMRDLPPEASLQDRDLVDLGGNLHVWSDPIG